MSSPLVASVRNPRFLLLWGGQAVSALGDRFNQLALLSLVMAGNTSWEQAKLDFCAFFPFLLGPFAGVLVDRMSKKWLMIAADLVRFVLVLALFAFGLREGADLSSTYPLLLAMGLMTTLFSPTKSACLPELCEPAQVLPATALLAATGVTATAVGGILAGKVIDLWGWRVCLVLDAVTFLVSAAAVWWIAFPPSAAPQRPPGFRQILGDLKEGFREILGNAELLKICAFLFTFWFVANSVKVVSPDFAKQVLGVGAGDMTAVGKILALAGLGLLAGAGATAVLGHRIARRAAYLFASAGMGLAIFALAGCSTMGAALTCLFLAGFAGGTLVSRIEADILKVIRPEIRGRVFGANAMVFAVALLLPLLPIGWLTKHMASVAILRMLAAALVGLGAVMAVRLMRDVKAGKPLVLPVP